MFDTRKKFVRVTKLREDGFIEFDFAIGEVEVYVEMILPARAFDDFCALNKVSFLDEATSVRLDERDAAHWRLGDVNRKIINNPGGKRQA
ncbi:hypothetical protein DLREEDagrD3_26810 [Denitratisoma sp. agr-D3]